LRRRRAANPLQEAENQLDGPPRKRKRKSPTTDDTPVLSLPTAVVDLPTDVDSFRGVIWRKPDSAEQEPDLYEPGHGEKVALLKDWREVFRTSHYKNDRLRESHPPSKPGLNGHVSERHLNLPEHTLRELAPPGQDDTVMDEGYGLVLESEGSYSPPPETIGETGRPHHEHKIRNAPHLRTTSLLREVMAVDDELSNVATGLPSSEKEDSVGEGMSTEQQEAGIQKLLRVEIPAAPDESPPPLIPSRRRRGRKPRASMAAEEEGSIAAPSVSPPNHRGRPGRKPRASMAAEEQKSSPRSRHPRNNATATATVEEGESSRRSTRVTSLQQQSRASSNDRKRRRRASSPAAPSTLRRSKRAKAA
jgi:hypothetical protein